MKILTLNTHSWIDGKTKTNLRILAKQIITENYDIICLQEVNQLVESALTVSPERFCPVTKQTPIHVDNFALLLVQQLAELGQKYYWSWTYSHVGYDLYQEGSAILAKEPLTSQSILVSQSSDPLDYHTRRILLSQTTYKNQQIIIGSCHFSWWQDQNLGFAAEWQKLTNVLDSVDLPIYLGGDFNQPAGESGYQLFTKNQLNLSDSYKIAQQKTGDFTVSKKIDGWTDNQSTIRIDYLLVPSDSKVTLYQTVFTGDHLPQISDHYGVAIDISD